jgi:hypothetical protein
MLASDIINDTLRLQLGDTDAVVWTDADLMSYLTEALTATAFVKPDMYVLNVDFTLAAGPDQVLPTDGIAFIDITQNVSGRTVSQVSSELLQEAARFWPAATQETVVEHYTADPDTPRMFRVFPPNDGTGHVWLKYGAYPPAVTTLGQTLVVPNSYQAVLNEYVLYKAYGVNSKKQDLTKSVNCKQQWGQMLGLKNVSQRAVAPKVSESPDV